MTEQEKNEWYKTFAMRRRYTKVNDLALRKLVLEHSKKIDRIAKPLREEMETLASTLKIMHGEIDLTLNEHHITEVEKHQ